MRENAILTKQHQQAQQCKSPKDLQLVGRGMLDTERMNASQLFFYSTDFS